MNNIASYFWLILACVVCDLATGSAQPTSLIFERISDDAGLPNNQFRYMIQDRHGLLWMGGGDGLACYDGYSAKSFRHSNADTTSISGNNILALHEDGTGRLWVGSFSGLDVSDTRKNVFRRVPLSDTASFTPQLVRHITSDAAGNIWLSMDTMLMILEEKGNNFIRKDIKEFFGDPSMCAALKRPTTLFTDSLQRVWIGTTTGICMYDQKEKRMYCPDELQGSPQSSIQDIGYDRLGRLWISCHSSKTRLFYTDAHQISFKPFDGIPFKQPPEVIHFDFDFDNRLWASAFVEQVYGYDFRDSTLFFRSTVNSNIRNERFLRHPFVDHSGNIWIPGEGYLVYHYPKGFRNYLHPFSFNQSATYIYGTDDYLWLAYRDEGLVRLNTKTEESINLTTKQTAPYQISDNRLTRIFRTKSDHLIIVEFGVVDILDKDGKLIRSHRIPGTNRAGFEDSKGRIWIGGITGLHLLSEEEGVIATYKLSLKVNDSRQFIQGIAEDKHGRIWFGSGIHGIGMLQPETGELKEFFPVPGDIHSLPSGTILDMQIDGNVLWIASDVALVKLDIETHRINSYAQSEGFESDFIQSIVCGSDGNIWVGTNRGISAFNPKTETVTNFGIQDGLLNRNYWAGSRYQSPDGVMYFGGENGVDFFHPSQLRRNPSAPKMYLSGITVDNRKEYCEEEIAARGKLVLSYKDDHIEFEFTGIHYAAQNKVRYQYMLEGMHEQWIDLGNQRHVVFSDLAPDEYVFRAKAISADGVEAADQLEIPLHILPPFYATVWFRLLSICALAAMLFGYMKYRERRIQRKERQEAEVARKISELEKRALQAQMNPHFIYNCMNSIQQFMILHDYEGAMKYLTRFSRLLRTVLNMSAQHRIALSDEVKLIEDYLELENMRFPNKFSYRIEVSPELNIHTVEIPPFFIQPQVENAVRHGLINKKTQGNLLVQIGKMGQHMRVIVEDNGVGRDAALAAKHNDQIIHESKGLTIVKERLAHLHSENGVHPFHITDLYDTEGKASGTRVEITLPLE